MRSALATLVVLLALVLGEVGWRTLVPPREAARQAAQYVRRSLAYLDPCARVERAPAGARLVGIHPEYTGGTFDCPLDKRDGVLRIAVVGESTGAMLGGSLHDQLAGGLRDDRIQVLMCAQSGSSLEHVQRRAGEVLAYRPDVLVVVFGHNLLMQYPTDRWRLRILDVLQRSRMLAELAHALFERSEPALPDYDARLAAMEHWLDGLAERAAERGVILIVTTMTPNLWMPPVASAGERRHPELARARIAYARGARDQAIARVADLVATRDVPHWRFVLGMWLARAGRIEDAREQLVGALDGERVQPDRARPALNRVLRRLAAQDNVLVHDIQRAIEQAARAGLPGWDVMRDNCHLRQRWIDHEARTVLALAEQAAGIPEDRRVAATLSGDAERPSLDGEMTLVMDGILSIFEHQRGPIAERWGEALALAVEQWLAEGGDAAAQLLHARLGQDVLARLDDAEQRVRLLTAVAEGHWWAGRHRRARELNARARAIVASGAAKATGAIAATRGVAVDGPADAWIQLGLFALGDGDEAAARAAFTEAQARAPAREDIRAFMAATGQSSSRPSSTM